MESDLPRPPTPVALPYQQPALTQAAVFPAQQPQMPPKASESELWTITSREPTHPQNCSPSTPSAFARLPSPASTRACWSVSWYGHKKSWTTGCAAHQNSNHRSIQYNRIFRDGQSEVWAAGRSARRLRHPGLSRCHRERKTRQRHLLRRLTRAGATRGISRTLKTKMMTWELQAAQAIRPSHSMLQDPYQTTAKEKKQGPGQVVREAKSSNTMRLSIRVPRLLSQLDRARRCRIVCKGSR